MKHSAQIKYSETQVIGENIIVFITYSDQSTNSHYFPCSIGKDEILNQSRQIAKTKVDALNEAERIKEEIKEIITETIE